MSSFKSTLLMGLIVLMMTNSGLSQGYLIKVKFSEAKLFLIRDNAEAVAAFRVGLPKFIPKYLPIEGMVARIEENPYWYPTQRGRELHLTQKGEELPVAVKPGDPRNAMGAAKIIIEFENPDVNPLIRIHGTNEKDSIGKRVSSGCIRMLNDDILTLIEIINGKQTKFLFEN